MLFNKDTFISVAYAVSENSKTVGTVDIPVTVKIGKIHLTVVKAFKLNGVPQNKQSVGRTDCSLKKRENYSKVILSL